MSKSGIKYFKEGKDDEAFKKLVIFVKNTKKTLHKNYYNSHQMIDVILERHQLSKKTLKWLQIYKASLEFQIIMAKVYYFGSGVDRDYTTSIKFLKDINTHYGLYLLGNMYSNGSGVKQSDIKALELFKRSCNLGDVHAQYTMGNHYKGLGDNETAMKCYKNCLIFGNTVSSYALGIMYEEMGDDKNTIKCFKKCVLQGHRKAIIKLGKIYEKDNLYVAIKFYENIIGDFSFDRELCKKLGSLYIKKKEESYNTYEKQSFLKKAIILFKRLNDGTDGEVLYSLGMLHARTTDIYISIIFNRVLI
jgi:tetratricopeptide (TPR) repeat protein